MPRLFCCLCAAALLVLTASPARANSQDFQLYKLKADGASQAVADLRFKAFANQLGAAISSFNLAPPETLGHSAFNFAIEYGAAVVDTDQSVWPTEGTPPSAMLMIPSVHVRKGLPFSFEVGGRFAYLMYSRMSAATVEAKWALNEGFFYIPDIGIRGHGTHLLGARDFSLTTAGVDIGIGKQIALGGMFTLTPYVGFDLLFVSGTSNVVDFKPDRTLESAQTSPTEDTGVFESANMLDKANRSNRYYGGMRLVANVFELGAEFSLTQLSGDYDSRQVQSFAVKLGLDF